MFLKHFNTEMAILSNVLVMLSLVMFMVALHFLCVHMTKPYLEYAQFYCSSNANMSMFVPSDVAALLIDGVNKKRFMTTSDWQKYDDSKNADQP